MVRIDFLYDSRLRCRDGIPQLGKIRILKELFEQMIVDVVLEVTAHFVAGDHSFESSCVVSASS